MVVSFPSCARARCMASSDPSASPSGCSCEVTRNRSPARSVSTTAAMSLFVVIARLFGAGIQGVDQLGHPDALLDRLIVLEDQLRGPPEMELLVDLRLQQ